MGPNSRANYKQSDEPKDSKIPTEKKGKESRNFNNYGGPSNQDIPNQRNVPLKYNPGVEKTLFSPSKQIKNEKSGGFPDNITWKHKEDKKNYEQTQPLNISEKKTSLGHKVLRDDPAISKDFHEESKNTHKSQNNTKEVLTTDSKDSQSHQSRHDTADSSENSEPKQPQVVEKDLNSSPESLALKNKSKTVDHKKVFSSKPIGINNEGNTCYL